MSIVFIKEVVGIVPRGGDSFVFCFVFYFKIFKNKTTNTKHYVNQHVNQEEEHLWVTRKMSIGR